MKNKIFDDAFMDQRSICEKYCAGFVPSSPKLKMGISDAALRGVLPLHGLRRAPEADTSGWYIWSGDYSENADFFVPIHVEHVLSEGMVFAQYLGLAPGWRFLIGEEGYEDVWFDKNLLVDE